jgi:hypothetical protein
MSGAEVASLISAIDGRNDRDDGFFGDGIWGIIMLLIIAGLFSGNGFGWGNRGNGNIANDSLLSEEFIKRDIFNTNQNVSNTGCQTQRDVLESRYATQLGLTNLGANMQNCCCETQKEILQNRYDNALQTNTLQAQIQNCCCDLRAEGLANTQKILDKMCENEINQLRTDLQSAQLQISQLSQTANITNTLRPFPSPSYIVSSPYMSLYNPYNGCGCGNATII